MKIFYSWQSDIDSRYNRNFIKDCLERAIKTLNKDLKLNEAIRLDQDTKGVAGTPDIANTIFSKIKDSAIFIGDVTFIAGGNGNKYCSNPNVMIELGYALSSLTDLCIVNVMNTAFGEPEGNLPFDLTHKRWPIQYDLNENNYESKRDEREKLVKVFVEAIKPILEIREESIELEPLVSSPSLNNIRHHILSSESKQDWILQSIDSRSTSIYRGNVNLRIEVNFTEDGTQCADFREPWANVFLNSKAIGYWCDIYYGQTHIDRTILVSVDGGRVLLPLPLGQNSDGERVVVKPYDYRIAELFDSQDTLYWYFMKLGFEFGELDA
ncbi:TPA: hypothetical protein NJ450_004566 [Vibrio parahaemolyticus]|nr:hypothetical protein [Vibrio parahaemolyticus]